MRFLRAACGEQRGLVDHVRQVGTREPGRAAGEDGHVDRRVERLAARVHLQDRLASLEVGTIDHHLSVEAAGPEQRRVQDVGTVRRGHQDHGRPLIEAVHLDQELVQRLLALVVAAAEAGAAVTTDGIDLVDEHDRGRRRFRLLEQVADARGAHAHEHLHEVGAADREERHPRFAGNGAREQRLAGARWSEQEHTPRDLRAHRLELGRGLQVLLDLLELLDRVVHAGDVGERRLRLVLRDGLVPAAAELHHAPTAALRAVHHPEQDPGDQDDRQDHRDERGDERVGELRIGVVGHARVVQQLLELVTRLGEVRGAVRAARRVVVARDHLVAFEELGGLDLAVRRPRRGTPTW